MPVFIRDINTVTNQVNDGSAEMLRGGVELSVIASLSDVQLGDCLKTAHPVQFLTQVLLRKTHYLKLFRTSVCRI